MSDSSVETMNDSARIEQHQEAAPQSAGDTSAGSPDRQRIAMRAYELYLARGASDGAALDDWLTAEREVASPNPDREREAE